ncbi:gfo/Idh/MocA family oxidoreductase [Neobacillus notoginsengisoli]|uniref:Gfo/Idh/MocA family oxidoreductase n=1 Tax=Neobacillus notoginsengisoli TaxID=1578198 RepID=A0A417YMT6_9BACI|nr:Gfo/Idh/MocA family oxidoreductase [Neobacillus notoginsengisoli]RHW34856.1 gfo/Idh/MocA family oxidoreductase [Neobacillus notoginsengisoli]
MKVGLIGLGDIAQKAYLPLISKMENIECHLYTRDRKKLEALGQKYRFPVLASSLEEMLSSGIEAAFVHSSTSSHAEIVRQLLEAGIHVFVDKPFTDNFAEARGLVELAEKQNRILMAGFNRRYAPAVNKLIEVVNPNLVLVQKNRHSLPGDIRTFIYDDFIHVIDTLRYLFPYPIEELIVNGRKDGPTLYHVVIQFVSPEGTAIGIMNRDNGATEEIATIMGPEEKRTAYNLSRLIISKGMEETEVRSGDWEETLVKRGFVSMTEDFLKAVRTGSAVKTSAQDALETHRICEEVISQLEK